MFLKRRNVIAWVLLLIGAAAWVLGKGEIRQSNYLTPTETTGFSAATFYTVFPTVPSVEQEAGPFRTDSGDGQQIQEQSRTARFTGYALCTLSVLLILIAVFALPQKKVLLGPDIVSGVGAVYSWTWHTYVQGNGSLPGIFYEQVPQILLLFFLLLAVRDLWGWILASFSLSWVLAYRAAKRCPLPQLAMMVFLLWITASIIGIALIFHGGAWFAMVLLIVMGGFGFLGLWHYGSDIQHFADQLDQFQQGSDISVGHGAFSQGEEKLKQVQQQHTRAIKAAVTSERFKVELIANVSHDLRTPLTSILGYSELLKKEALSPAGTEQLSRLYQKAGYMRDLVESLFELTKVSSGLSESNLQELDLIRLLEQTIGLLDDQLTSSGLTLRRSYEEPSAFLVTDGARMHQVFSNLLGNAIKYALPGTRIHLEVRKSEHAWIVRMVNTASYEMDFQEEEIMQRFARGDKARSTQGSGLGLAIAQTYTESVGGSFRIHVDGDQFNAIVKLPKL